MPSDTRDLQDILRRVEKLETENRRMRRALLAAALLAAAVLLMGQARPSRTVEADEFALKDKVGRRRAVLGFGPWRNVATLTFYYEKHHVTAYLDGSDEAALHLIGTGLDESVTLEAGKDAHGLFVYGNNALGEVVAAGSSAKIRVTDADGFETIIGSTELVTARTGETHKTSAASLVLFGKDSKVLWQAP